jgi:ATP-dependent protease ClpP protease subunit
MRSVTRFVALAMVGAATLQGKAARGDEVTLLDGKTFRGEVIAEDARSITLQMDLPGSSISLSRQFKKSQVKSVTRPKMVGPAYATLPVDGEIGKEVTAASLQAGFDEAKRAGAKYVVLDIDSGGGSIKELLSILDVVTSAQSNCQVVAYVHNAYSAAAILAMSCKQIYVTPRGVIGAAVHYMMTKNGPADVEAKFMSALEAKERAYIAAAGHDPLFLRGMMEMDVELHLETNLAGHPMLSTEGAGKVIKAKGTILTLTAAEAVETGLAHPAADIAEVGKQVAGGAWSEPTRRPWEAAMAVAASQERVDREQANLGGHPPTLTRAALMRAKPELDANKQAILELMAKRAANHDAIADLDRDADAKELKIASDYHAALANCKTQEDVAHAKDVRDAQFAEMLKTADATMAKLKSDGQAIERELKEVRAKQKDLIASLTGE